MGNSIRTSPGFVTWLAASAFHTNRETGRNVMFVRPRWRAQIISDERILCSCAVMPPFCQPAPHLTTPLGRRRIRRVGRQPAKNSAHRSDNQASRPVGPRGFFHSGEQPHAFRAARQPSFGQAGGTGKRQQGRHPPARHRPEAGTNAVIRALGAGEQLGGLAVGYRVSYASYAGTEIKIDGEDWLVLGAEDIIGVWCK